MAPKELLALRLLLDNPRGLFGSELVHLSAGIIGRGTVYALLERMVDSGNVREFEEPATSSYSLPRTRHFITDAGKTAYMLFLKEQRLCMDAKKAP